MLQDAVRVGLDSSRGVERTVQVLAAHCVLKQSSGIMAIPGTWLVPALSTDREQQQQHILMPASAKAAPAQRHASAASVWQQGTHIRLARTYAHTHTHTYTYTHARAHKRPQMPKHTGTHTCTHAYVCTRCGRDGLRQTFSVASDAPTLVLVITMGCQLSN